MNQEAMRYFSGDAWVEKVGGRRSCNFPTDSSKFLKEGALNFNSHPTPPKWGIFSLKFRIFDRKFSDKNRIFREAKILGRGNCPPTPPTATTALRCVVICPDRCSQAELAAAAAAADDDDDDDVR